jgi:ArsR family transcriptional regulator, cadmium/lead-responsive transcriptional repressor
LTQALLKDAPFDLPATPTRIDLVSKYFRGLGDPTRLRILEALRGGELSVNEIVEAVGASQPRVSNHLACLRWCGFVASRRDAQSIRYSIADRRVARILDLTRELLEENKDHVAACEQIDGEGC